MRSVSQLMCVSWLFIACGGNTTGPGSDDGCEEGGTKECDSGRTSVGASDATTTSTSSVSPDSGGGSSANEIPDGSAPGATVYGTLPDGAAVECCPISGPSCCMEYGGAKLEWCGMRCDGMPWPNAAWQLGEDKYGCPIWIEPPRTDDFCGAYRPPPDSNVDAGAETDASSALDGAAADADGAATDGAAVDADGAATDGAAVDADGAATDGAAVDADGAATDGADGD